MKWVVLVVNITWCINHHIRFGCAIIVTLSQIIICYKRIVCWSSVWILILCRESTSFAFMVRAGRESDVTF